jgi:pyruvate/2-oxoglutarate dehydrogenase complex dihydrolipoamide acyltransferase (E2) component
MKVWEAIKDKFVKTASGGLVNERLEREREMAVQKSITSSARATKAAKARWNATSNAPSNAPSIDSDLADSKPMLQAMLEQCPPDSDPDPYPDSDSEPTPLEGDARGNLCVTEKSGGNGGTPKPKSAEVEVTAEQKEIAATMIVEKKPLTTISRVCGIPMATVQQLRKELGA